MLCDSESLILFCLVFKNKEILKIFYLQLNNSGIKLSFNIMKKSFLIFKTMDDYEQITSFFQFIQQYLSCVPSNLDLMMADYIGCKCI